MYRFKKYKTIWTSRLTHAIDAMAKYEAEVKPAIPWDKFGIRKLLKYECIPYAGDEVSTRELYWFLPSIAPVEGDLVTWYKAVFSMLDVIAGTAFTNELRQMFKEDRKISAPAQSLTQSEFDEMLSVVTEDVSEMLESEYRFTGLSTQPPWWSSPANPPKMPGERAERFRSLIKDYVEQTYYLGLSCSLPWESKDIGDIMKPYRPYGCWDETDWEPDSAEAKWHSVIVTPEGQVWYVAFHFCKDTQLWLEWSKNDSDN